ncbi:N-acyl-D-amino-acid deacylase family protein [Humibacter albus]|uniref:N-acyl-D-amino-acid deacylase family protein n=1 Tax=Humibacter albus TaxID=427754 RepID=UPI0003B545AD|nr:amidohydrolase family protein [Humibacter albus]
MPTRVVLRGGEIVSAGGVRRADVAVRDGVIAALGQVEPVDGDHVVDCGGRYVLPGFVDAHSHADGLLGDDGVQRSLLRQGVTSVICGQDGVSYAPGDGRYASDYFGAINGDPAAYAGDGVAGYLASIDGTTRVNAGYLVPAGTVRFEVCGRDDGAADAAQLARMLHLVESGLREGALGLSTGLDYVPGLFQSSEEIAALCEPVARAGGVYVSHLRGGYEANTVVGTGEAARIADRVLAATGSRLPVHVSHLHADADIVLGELETLAARGHDVTFDAYPYVRGCSLMTMPLLPPALSARPTDEVVRVLGDPEERERLRRDWFPLVAHNPSLGPQWPRMITLAGIEASEYAWMLGLTLAQAAGRAGRDVIDLALDVMRASRLGVSIVMAVQNPRPVSELARIFAHPAHVGGSDGIFLGGHPHPRARGTFARFLREYVRETATWSWPDAVRHLSLTAAERFGLGRRGEVAVGAVADLAVVDPGTVADRATYEEPLRDAVGIDDVLVAGVPVLHDGELTDARPGRGLRRASRSARKA